VDEPTYACLVGHDIPVDELDQYTEVVILDGGARVRICREHGAPIAVSVDGTQEKSDLRL
jgi:hypothetical protein